MTKRFIGEKEKKNKGNDEHKDVVVFLHNTKSHTKCFKS